MIRVYDVETFINCFTYIDYDPHTKEINQFVITDFQNEHTEFVQYIKMLEKKKAGMVGFNNLHFDWPVVSSIVENRLNTGELIYSFAQTLINAEKKTYSKQSINQLDLYLLNHYDNKARSTSLKALEVSCGWDNVMDMPMDHTTTITPTNLPTLLEYNKNDVLFTAKFYSMCKEKIELRKKISKKYKLKVMNKSDVIIGESIFLKYLSDTMDMPVAQLKEIRGKRTDVALKKIIFPYVSFVEPGFQKLMRLMQETVSSSQFLRNFVENMDTRLSTNELFDKFRDNNIRVQRIAQQKKSFSFSVQYNNIQIDYGVGGIHGCVKPGVYQSNFTHGILDIDVKSYYPNLFIQNRLHPKQMDQDTFIKVYSDIFQERVKAQKEGDKLTSDALKLALNGLFGKTGSDVSCFYDPNVFFAVTVNGQLLLTMLVERLVRQGASLLQVNTDGVTILYSYLPFVFIFLIYN